MNPVTTSVSIELQDIEDFIARVENLLAKATMTYDSATEVKQLLRVINARCKQATVVADQCDKFNCDIIEGLLSAWPTVNEALHVAQTLRADRPVLVRDEALKLALSTVTLRYEAEAEAKASGR